MAVDIQQTTTTTSQSTGTRCTEQRQPATLASEAAERGLGWGQNHNHRGSGDPSEVQGQSPVMGSGDEVPEKLKNFKSSYKQILRIFGSISHIFHLHMPMFFRACRHRSTKSAKWWGHFIPFAPPLSASGGQLPPLPPAPPPMVSVPEQRTRRPGRAR